jgi:hypothetical protein
MRYPKSFYQHAAVISPKRLLKKVAEEGDAFYLKDRVMRVFPEVDAEMWAERMRADALKIHHRFIRGQRAGWKRSTILFALKDGPHSLTVYRKTNSLLWLLDQGHGGAGRLLRDSDSRIEWYETAAGITKAYRGKGIYAAILQVLKRFLGKRIWSDKTLSPRAKGVWRQVGAFHKSTGRFRQNPKRQIYYITTLDGGALLEALNYYSAKV